MTTSHIQSTHRQNKVVLRVFLIDFHIEICPIMKKIGYKPDYVDFCNNSV